MSVNTVQIKGADGTLYDVAGEIIGGVFYPIYINLDQSVNKYLLDGVKEMVVQQKISNAYSAIILGQTITEEDL